MLDEEGATVASMLLQGPPPIDPASAPDDFSKTMLTADSVHNTVKDSLQNMDLTQLKEVVTGENPILKNALSSTIDMVIGFVPKLLGAVLVLWIGFKLIKLLKRALLRLLDKRAAESSLKGFLTSFIDVLLKILLVIMAMDIIGIKATSFIAILGAMGLAIGMAMQGTLQNFAGGVILLLLKPFKVNDYIECGDYKGYVKDIRIFHTIIQPFNGRTIIIPNSELATKSLINHTKEPQIRLDLTVSVAYGSDLDKVKEVLKSTIDNENLILKEPIAPTIAVSNLNDSSVDLTLWLWVKTEDYWTLWKRIRESIYKDFYAEGIEIPFPQMDVTIKKQ